MSMTYLCQYGNCDRREPASKTFVVKWPNENSSTRFCSAAHAAMALMKHGKIKLIERVDNAFEYAPEIS